MNAGGLAQHRALKLQSPGSLDFIQEPFPERANLAGILPFLRINKPKAGSVAGDDIEKLHQTSGLDVRREEGWRKQCNTLSGERGLADHYLRVEKDRRGDFWLGIRKSCRLEPSSPPVIIS